MAEQDEIVIDVKINTGEVAKRLANATEQVRLLKQEQRLLDKALAEGKISQENYGKSIAESKAELEKASREVKSSTALLQAETLARIDANSSLDEQRQALNAAQKAYANLSGEERKAADAAGGLREQIGKLSDRVKQQEAAIGDARRNVGNYAMQTAEASSQMGFFGKATGGVITGVRGVTTGLKAMAATPVIAILNILVTLLVKVAERFRGNQAAMEKLTGVFGVFSGVGNIVNKIIDKIAEGIGWVAEKAVELADKLGLISAEMKAGQKIAQTELALQRKIRETQEQNANDQLKIAQLKAQAAEKDKRTASERLRMINEAIDLEEKVAQRSYNLAKEQYELKKLQNAQSNSSQEDLKEESDLYVAMINEQTNLFNKQKELYAQRTEATNQIKAEQKAAVSEAEKANKSLQGTAQTTLDDIAGKAAQAQALIEEMRKQNDELLNSIVEEDEEPYVPSVEEMALQWGLDQAGLDYYKSLIDDGFNHTTAKQMALSDQWQRNAYQITGIIGGIGDGFSALGDLVGNFADESEDAAKAQKAFALTGIITNQAAAIAEGAVALASGISSAAAQPFPLNLAAIATVVATITSLIGGIAGSISQAKQIFAQADEAGNFATGGIVGGTSYTGDKMRANVNSGEMILNKAQQSELFAALNGANNTTLGVDYGLMAAAMASVPAPVVVYKELQQFGDKVATYNEIASI